MTHWLIEPSALAEISGLNKREPIQGDFKCLSHGDIVFSSSNKKQGTISIVGPLMVSSSRWLDMFGVSYTTYDNINAALDAAEHLGVEKIRFEIDSPGGMVNGLMPLMDRIKGLNISTEAVITGMAASAAYMLGSQADTLEASHESNIVGSVGVMVTMPLVGAEVNITNTASPDKAPDVSSESGQDKVRAQLDELYDMVAARIASGRNITVEEVNNRFGKGATMTAKRALSAGMIDMIQTIKQPVLSGETTKGIAMNLEQLKAEHPETYNALYNEAYADGQKAEKNRVQGHLMLAEASGAMEKAVEDISSGAACDESVRNYHMAESIKQTKLLARKEDSAGEEGLLPSVDPQAEATQSLVTDGQKAQAEFDEFNELDGVEVTY